MVGPVSQLAADQRVVDAAAIALARGDIDPNAAGVNTVWKALDPDTKREYRDRAVEVLVAVDIELEKR